MYKFKAKNSNRGFYKNDNCKSACNNCKICQKDTRGYADCWSSCDACNACHVDYRNTKEYDEPYEYRPWFPEFNNRGYSKQFCDNICGVRMCKRYRKRLDDFKQCRNCQQKGQCWSPYQERCIDCDYNSAIKPCEDKYGCQNPRGYEFANVPPINPMFTNCMPCWDEKIYTTL